MKDLIDWKGIGVSGETAASSELPESVARLIRPLLDVPSELGTLVSDEILRCFGITNTSNLIRNESETGANITIIHSLMGSSIGELSFNYVLKITDQEVQMKSSIPENISLQITTGHRLERITIQRKLSSLKEQLKLRDIRSTKPTSEEHSHACQILWLLTAMTLPHIIGPLFSDAHYLPSDRTGIMHAYRVMVSTLIGSAAMSDLRPETQGLGLSGILVDFLRDLFGLDTDYSASRRSTDNVAKHIEDRVLRGDIMIERTDTGYPAFTYKPNGSSMTLPLMYSSSMVSELAPVVLYLRHIVRPGDVIIIEEPESHLHPEIQATFACELARLVQAGVRVIITTHSDLILEQIANLIRLSELPKDKRADILDTDYTLSANQVGAWLFTGNENGQGSVVQEAMLDEETGLFQVGYDSIRETLYNQGATAYNRLQDFKQS